MPLSLCLIIPDQVLSMPHFHHRFELELCHDQSELFDIPSVQQMLKLFVALSTPTGPKSIN